MPFRSKKQMAYLKHKQPAVYKKWVAKYGKKVVASKESKNSNAYTAGLAHA